MRSEEHPNESAYDLKLVEIAQMVVASGMEPEKFTAVLPVGDLANPDEKAIETARRVRALGCNTRFTLQGRRTIIYGSAAKGKRE